MRVTGILTFKMELKSMAIRETYWVAKLIKEEWLPFWSQSGSFICVCV